MFHQHIKLDPAESILSLISDRYNKYKNKRWLKNHPGFALIDANTRFDIIKKIGNGAFGTVYLAIDKVLERKVALKELKITRDNEIEIAKEVFFLSKMHHENIAEMIVAFKPSRKTPFAYIEMELCTGGELFDAIIQENFLPEATVKQITYELLSALQYCNAREISHMDLKPENIILSVPRWPDMPFPPIKIVDWGLASTFEDFEKCPCSLKGTPNYVAPEVILGQYNEKADIWSTGIIVYVMMCGRLPFHQTKVKETLTKILKEEVTIYMEDPGWSTASELCISFVEKLTVKSPVERPSAEEALQHEWFSTGVDNMRPEIVLTRLRHYTNHSKLKRTILFDIAGELDRAQTLQMAKLFKSIAKKSTYITYEQLRSGILQYIGEEDDPALQRMINEMDLDENEKIDIHEFIVAMMAPHLNTQALLTDFYDALELNTVLTLEKIKKFYGDDEIGQKAFEEIDTDNNGSISVDEFVNWIIKD